MVWELELRERTLGLRLIWLPSTFKVNLDCDAQHPIASKAERSTPIEADGSVVPCDHHASSQVEVKVIPSRSKRFPNWSLESFSLRFLCAVLILESFYSRPHPCHEPSVVTAF